MSLHSAPPREPDDPHPHPHPVFRHLCKVTGHVPRRVNHRHRVGHCVFCWKQAWSYAAFALRLAAFAAGLAFWLLSLSARAQTVPPMPTTAQYPAGQPVRGVVANMNWVWDGANWVQMTQPGGGGGGGTSSNFGAAFPTAGTAIGFYDGANMGSARVFDADSGGGTQLVLGVELRKSASGGSVELGTSSDPVRTDPTGTTVQPISATSLPLPASASQEHATAGSPSSARLSDGSAFYDAAKTGQLPSSLGQKAMSGSVGVTIASDQAKFPVQISQTGTDNDVDVTSLPSNASVNVAQFGGTNVVTGTGAGGAGIPRVTVSNDSVISVSGTSTTQPASTSSAENDGACPSGAANFTVLSAAAGRKTLFLWAKPSNTDYVYVKLGVTATTSDAQLAPGQPMNFDAGKVWDGQVDAIPASGTQSVCVVAL